MIARILREPLFHFLLAGAGLFALYHAVVGVRMPDTGKIIRVEKTDLLTYMQYRARAFDPARAEAAFAALDSSARAELIADYVRFEALWREAKALELDANDFVARQRLVQQVEFLTRGFVEQGSSLDEAALEAFYAENAGRYEEPARITFTHVFFSTDRRPEAEARALAEAELDRLEAEDVAFSEALGRGDRFLYNVTYVETDRREIESYFGPGMTEALFDAPIDDWAGPFRSPLGFHIVRIAGRSRAHVPPLETIEARVRSDALTAQEEARFEAAVGAILEAYEVELAPGLAEAEPAP
ncbi:MAG: peptidyl-prolyl cis-trans isomerase [Alphaproteobacteria bacterium]|nr:peptidyl-prolyl cis-trans isomerase [Alphaproteobacteria bacterium]